MADDDKPWITRQLTQYQGQKLILSWREVPGRGLVVIGADMAEWTLASDREAEVYLGGLASAVQAYHAGEAGSA